MSGGDWKEMLVAVQLGDLSLVKYHLANGIDPNYEHPELMTTPLIESIEYGHYEIAKFLLDSGADASQKAWLSNDTPLRMAKKKGDKRMVLLIRSHLPKKGFWSFFRGRS